MNLDDRINAFMAISFEYFCGNMNESEGLRFDLKDILEVNSLKGQSPPAMNASSSTN